MTWAADPLSAAALTADQPFCAGVVIMDGGGIVVTLNTDHLPLELTGTAWRVGGVGGGQEPGETIWQCAVREAAEEALVLVELQPAPVTYLHDADTDEIVERHCTDTVAPVLIQRRRRPSPDVAYKPGLPTGPYLYLAFFLATPVAEPQTAGDDVQALLTVPLSAWARLESTPTIADMVAAGARVVGDEPVDPAKRLWLPPEETLSVLVPILQRRPELLAGLE